MESSESESSSWLEILPIEVNTVIASYLKARDVGQCCATSSTMRDIFSDNSIWRPRCKKELAEYLKITPGKVVPIFVNPQLKNSSLSPLPEWRISYMRENHLWNNWRKGKYVKEQINSRSCLANFHMFYNNDCVIAIYEDRIELVDVSRFPAVKVVENVYFGTKKPSNLNIEIANDMIVFLSGSGVQVFEVDVSRKKCSFKHMFFFEKSLATTNSGSHENTMMNFPQIGYRKTHLIVGNIFIGILKGESTMHIWNLETGQKLKEETCLLKHCQVLDVKATSDTMHVVLTVGKAEQETKSLFVYSLEALKFLSFNETLNMNSEFSVYKDFVFIRYENIVRVFNYQTSIMLAAMPTDSFPGVIKNNLLFIKNRDIIVFNLIETTTESLSLNFVSDFEILGDRFIQLLPNSWGSGKIWEFDDSCQHISPTDMKLYFRSCGFFLNKACTRYIVREDLGYTLNFW